jgi:hypothetical protein
MSGQEWVREFDGAITTCDPEGIILDMNDMATRVFEKRGGRALIGTNLLECHPEPARTKLLELLATRQTNVYTIEKHGSKKLIYQAPWYVDGKYRGFVELSVEIPKELPHFVRD